MQWSWTSTCLVDRSVSIVIFYNWYIGKVFNMFFSGKILPKNAFLRLKKSNFSLHTPPFEHVKYCDRYKLSPLQRLFLVPYYGVQGLIDPSQGQHVAAIGDITSTTMLRQIHQSILRQPTGTSMSPIVSVKILLKLIVCFEGKEFMSRKALITNDTLNLPFLRSLPKGTLGRGYVDYMDNYGFSADERSKVKFAEDVELAYVLGENLKLPTGIDQ